MVSDLIKSMFAEPDPSFRRPTELICPHCQSSVEVSADVEVEVLCRSCGSSFRLDPDGTQVWTKDKLPVLGKFELIEEVGRGAFGTVYRALDTTLERIVAVKVPRSGQLLTGEDEARFVREARSAAQLHHAGIVPVFEVGRTEFFTFIVSEFVHGVTLSDALTARRFSFRESAELVVRTAAALQHAHDQGIVHRDLKPSNIMLTSDGTPRVMDFGLAKRDTGESTVTMDGEVLGTPAYMSPEQACGHGHLADARADVYSLGVILYELLTGELPFRGNSRMLLHQVLNDSPRAPRCLNDEIPRDLETICLRAMAKEPSRRYATATHLGEDVKRWLSGEPVHARPTSGWETLLYWCCREERTRDAGLLGSFVCAMCLVFLTTWLAYYWIAGIEIARPTEFVWQGAIVNSFLILGVAVGRLVIRRSLVAMWTFLSISLLFVVALIASIGDWLPPGYRFRAGGVYDNVMVRVTLFSIFISMGTLIALLMALGISAHLRIRRQTRILDQSRSNSATRG